jgi:uncharacterized protein YbjT (DUF2867 family)
MENTFLVIGGTGAMGRSVVRALMSDPVRQIRILTRDLDGRHARALTQAGNGQVQAVQGDLNDEASLAAAMSGVHAVFCNTDFFSTASPLREYEQGVRALRTAKAAEVKHFIWSSLDFAGALTGGRIPVPHYDAKAAVAAWIDLMRSEETMQDSTDRWFSRSVTTLVTGPYFENLQAGLVQPATLKDGRHGQRFNIAIGAGRWPLIAIDDIAWFARHIFDHPDTWRGRSLKILSEALTGPEIAATFERVTGVAAEFSDVPLQSIRAIPAVGHDLANMFQFFQEYDVIGRERDIAALRRLHPGLMTFEDWLRTSGWRGAAPTASANPSA